MPKRMGKCPEHWREPVRFSSLRNGCKEESLLFFFPRELGGQGNGTRVDGAVVLEEFFSYFSPGGQPCSPTRKQGIC